MVSRGFAHLPLPATPTRWTQPKPAVSGFCVKRSNSRNWAHLGLFASEIFLEQVIVFATIRRSGRSSHLHPHEGISLLQGDHDVDQYPCTPPSCTSGYEIGTEVSHDRGPVFLWEYAREIVSLRGLVNPSRPFSKATVVPVSEQGKR